jgi:hypothetical protein
LVEGVPIWEKPEVAEVVERSMMYPLTGALEVEETVFQVKATLEELAVVASPVGVAGTAYATVNDCCT